MAKFEVLFFAVLLCLIALILLFSFDFYGDFAINDDWGYSTPIRWWVEDRMLALTHWQSMPLFTQLVFGGIWTEIFGFSQGALRQMTLVFALITCSALFVCARNLQLPISVCLLSALLPLASPIFVGLSYSFMTDVPAAAFVMLSLSFFIRSFNKSDGGSVDYSMGFVFLLLAVLLRQTSVAIALALVVAEPAARGFSLRQMARPLTVLVTVILAYVAFNVILQEYFTLPRAYGSKTSGLLTFVGDVFAANFGAFLQTMKALLIASSQFGLIALPIMPIFSSILWRRGRGHILVTAGITAILTVASLVIGVGVLSPSGGNMLTAEGIGPRNITGEIGVSNVAICLITTIGHFGFACSVLVAASSIGTTIHEGGLATKNVRGGTLLLFLTAILLFAPHTVAYSAIFDRYALLPSILLVLVVLRVVYPISFSKESVWSSGVIIGAGFALSLLLTADFFRWQEARYTLIDRLLSDGFMEGDIDGGFEYNNLIVVLERPEEAVSMNLVNGTDRQVRLTKRPNLGEEVIFVEEYSRFFGLGLGQVYAVR